MKIIQETGYEGNIYNNFQVLNFHEKSGNYYTRINICGVYKIARMPLQDIINNRVPDKFPGKLVGNPYLHLDDGTTIIFDINGIEIYIDTEDFDRIKHITWSSTPSNDNYVAGNIKDNTGKQHKRYLHQVIMKTEFDDRTVQVDHIDLDVLNNRKYNLRICDNRTNNLNKHIHKSIDSDILGIYEVTEDKYKAVVKINGKSIHLGTGTLEQTKNIRKLVIEHINTHKNITIEQINLFKKQVGILDSSAENDVYANNELGIKYIRFDKKAKAYQVRINFKDGRGTVYCGSRKNIEEAIKLRDSILNNKK